MESGPDLRLVLKTLVAVEKGDFSVSLPRDWEGIGGKIADSLNNVIDLNRRMTGELDRIGKGVGKEGKLSKRVDLEGGLGSWASMKNPVNGLVDDLSRPITEMTRVIGAVSKGDFSQTVNTEVEGRPLQGEFLGAAKTVNAMVEQLGAFTSEVTRVAREVGTAGKLGGQAEVPGVAGTWKDLTDNVNFMASNLTDQVRGIVKVVTAVANGNLRQKLTVEAKGEVAIEAAGHPVVATRAYGKGRVVAFAAVMDQKKWDKLPADVKKVPISNSFSQCRPTANSMPKNTAT